MDFAPRPSFSATPRPAFGRHAEHREDGPPPVFKGKAAVRRARMMRDAREVLDDLPGPGEAVHAITTGNYDLMLLIVALIDLAPVPCRRLRLATLAFARRNAVEMLALLETKKVGELTVLASCFFKGHNKELFESFREDLAAFPGCRVGAARSHCKVATFDFSDGGSLVLEGSANLRTNHNREQFCLCNDRALHDFHAGWIESLVNHAKNDRE